MRSEELRSSSVSDEKIIIPTPCAARRFRLSYISCFAPTSTPRVGSSSSTNFFLAAIQRDSTIFCWFPPLKEVIFCSVFLGWTLKSSIIWSVMSCSFFLLIRKPTLSSMEIVMFFWAVKFPRIPSSFLEMGTYPIPFADAS